MFDNHVYRKQVEFKLKETYNVARCIRCKYRIRDQIKLTLGKWKYRENRDFLKS